MESLSVFKAFGDGFKGLIKNLVFLLILLGVHLGLTYGIEFIFNSFFPELSSGNYALLEMNYRLGFSEFILNTVLALIAFVYKTYMTLLLLNVFFNYHLNMEMTIPQMILYSFNKIATVLRVYLLFIPIFIIFMIVTSSIIFHFEHYLFYLGMLIAFIGMFFISFFQHGIIVNEFGAIKSIANSFSFIKTHFMKVLGFTVISYGSQWLFTYVSGKFITRQVLNSDSFFLLNISLAIITVLLLILSTYFLSSSMALYCQTVEVVEEDEDEMDLQAIY